MEEEITNSANGESVDESPQSKNTVTPSSTKVTGEKQVKKHRASSKYVTVVFRQNRKFDLHVGREMIEFSGRESKRIPKSWLEHPDFLQVRHYFSVKGV